MESIFIFVLLGLVWSRPTPHRPVRQPRAGGAVYSGGHLHLARPDCEF